MQNSYFKIICSGISVNNKNQQKSPEDAILKNRGYMGKTLNKINYTHTHTTVTSINKEKIGVCIQIFMFLYLYTYSSAPTHKHAWEGVGGVRACVRAREKEKTDFM